jgi:hypothetical protein
MQGSSTVFVTSHFIDSSVARPILIFALMLISMALPGLVWCTILIRAEASDHPLLQSAFLLKFTHSSPTYPGSVHESRWRTGATVVCPDTSATHSPFQGRVGMQQFNGTVTLPAREWSIYMVHIPVDFALATFYTVEIRSASDIWESEYLAIVVRSSLSKDNGDTIHASLIKTDHHLHCSISS